MSHSSALAYHRPRGRPLGALGRDSYVLSPRVRAAIRLYATGACKTKKEASEAAGLHPATLTMYYGSERHMEAVNKYHNEITEMLDDKTVDLDVAIQHMARKALSRVHELMHSNKDEVSLKAATEILDRNPSTQKVIRAQVETFSLNGQDAKEITQAILEAARVKAENSQAAMGDYVRVALPAVIPSEDTE